MTTASIDRLQYLCDIIPPLLAKIGEEAFSFKPSPGKWSKKEILGHLIDSATNNHHRFVRAQFEEAPRITYNQELWNAAGHYNQMNSRQLISFWTDYNRHLVMLLRHIPEERAARICDTGSPSPVTLRFVADDYVTHLEHHLMQLVDY